MRYAGRVIARLSAGIRERRRAFVSARPAWKIAAIATIAIIVCVNVVLLSAYFWSRGGQRLHVRVEARGTEFSAYVDGKLRQDAVLDDAGSTGDLVLGMTATDTVSTLPHPRGVENVRVTDLDTGDVLYQDDFGPGYEQNWTIDGDAVRDGGVVGFPRGGSLRLKDRHWTNYAVDVTFQNVQGADVVVRNANASSAVVYHVLPFWWLSDGFILGTGTQFNIVYNGPLVEPDREQSTRSTVAMALAAYPRTAFLFGAAAVAVVALQLLPFRRVPIRLSQAHPVLLRWLPWASGLTIATIAFGVALFLHRHYSADLPHGPDPVSYLFEAKIIASGHLSAPAPPVEEAFTYFFPTFTPVVDGRWASIYPFGHPLALAVGVKLGAVWIIPPLLFGLSVLMIFAIGRTLFSTRVGIVAAMLLAASPFAMVSASDYMSHNTAVFYLLASLLCLTLIRKQPLAFGVLAGLFFGLLLNTRPLTTTALVPPFGAVLVARMIPRGQRWAGTKELLAFVAGVAVMLGAYLLYNYGSTGDAFQSTAAANGDLGNAVGFAGRHSVGVGAANLQTDMAFLLLILNGWPTYIGLMFVLVPFITGTRNPWDWFLLAGAVSAMGIYILYEGSGIQYGPRYWYEATPFLMLLTARGADRAAMLLGEAGALIRGKLRGRVLGGRWAGAVVVYGFVAALVAFSLYSWLLGRNVRYHVFASSVPESAQSLKGFNDIDDRLQKKIDAADLHNALVLMDPCFWQCYGSVFWLNDPGLDGDVVYAVDAPSVRADVLAAFPDRDVYFARYRGEVTLEPYTLDRGRTGKDPATKASGSDLVTAKELLAVVPPVAPTPIFSADEVPARDEQRKRDLSAVSAALDTYRMRHGVYPATGSVHSLCFFPADAGCKLQEVLFPLPKDPRERGYWYQSDGSSFVLFAALEGKPVASDCPRPLPNIVGATNSMYCLRSAGG